MVPSYSSNIKDIGVPSAPIGLISNGYANNGNSIISAGFLGSPFASNFKINENGLFSNGLISPSAISDKNAVSSAAVGGVNANRNYGGNNGHGIATTLPDISSALLGSTYGGNIGLGEKNLPTDSILSKYVR
ncbi:hypothetical protein CDAR_366461 [Caerostris darwini]|uniref:Uncharacterized protein n=1 Tax=Caerostris darwini TaxID=1538125 RepID=A0AAV4Q5M6_9ARAC|nr:hypothetical protein CDAR_366461 [Caerostris darwini]